MINHRRHILPAGIAASLFAVALGMAEPPAPALAPHPQALKNSHPPGEVDRPEMVKFIVPDPASLPGIVVDETAAELVGEWQYSTHTPPYVGLGYLHDLKAGKGSKSITFTPTLPQAGWYEVRLAHCYNVRRSTKTPVTIHHADGEITIRINQQEAPPYGRLFRSLGTFRFEAGHAGWVRVSNEGTEPDKVVVADAVQFLPTAAPKSNSLRRSEPVPEPQLRKARALAKEVEQVLGMPLALSEDDPKELATEIKAMEIFLADHRKGPAIRSAPSARTERGSASEEWWRKQEAERSAVHQRQSEIERWRTQRETETRQRQQQNDEFRRR